MIRCPDCDTITADPDLCLLCGKGKATTNPLSLVADTIVPRRFKLVRDEDVSAMSGIGFVAEGVMFWDGVCAMRWRTEIRTTTVYDSLDDLLAIHGHEGRTTIKWIDA